MESCGSRRTRRLFIEPRVGVGARSPSDILGLANRLGLVVKTHIPEQQYPGLPRRGVLFTKWLDHVTGSDDLVWRRSCYRHLVRSPLSPSKAPTRPQYCGH